MTRTPSRVAWAMAAILGLLLGSGALASLARYERAVKKRPEDLRLRFLLGKKYTQAGQLQKAARQYQAILREKSIPTVMFQLGMVYAKMGDLTAAVLNWTPILERKPDNTRTMSYLGLALYRQGLQSPNEELRQRLFQESLDWWKRILKLEPGNLRARYFAGVEYFKLGRFEDAARQWLIFLRVKRNHPKVLSLLAKALMKMGRYQQARRTLGVLSGTPAAKSAKMKAFLRKAYRALDTAVAGGPPPRDESRLDPDETDRDAVARDDRSRPLPPGPEPPPPPPLGEPRPVKPPGEVVDETDTLQAETLFLDGLEYKEKGNYEKALFAFLQAIDIQPDFSQVYLQIGEVYLGLAKLAPTPDEFKERLRLAEDSLTKVKNLSPGTLLSHAGQSKLVVVKRSQKLGFTGYHEEVAKKAVQQDRIADAFDEFVLLLSVKDFRPTTFFQLAGILPKITEANRQDLRFFLEELKNQHPGHALTAYLLGRVYLASPDPGETLQLATQELADAESGFVKEDVLREAFAVYASTPRSIAVDHLLLARIHAKRKENDEALQEIEAFLEAAEEDHPFYQEAAQLKEQLAIALRPTMSEAARVDHFKEEKLLLERTVKQSQLFFKLTEEGIPQLSPGHLEDEARFRALTVFVENNPHHGLGRFLLGWLLKRRAVTPRGDGENGPSHQAGVEAMSRAHAAHLTDPDYHFEMGRLCLLWSLVDPDLDVEAHRFFQTTRNILLAFGRIHDKSFARRAIEVARFWMRMGKISKAEAVGELALLYDKRNLEVYGIGFEMTWNQGDVFAAVAGLGAWFMEAMGHLWVRQIVLSDLAILAFLTLLGAMLAWSLVLLIRYHGELRYLFQEFWRSKGIVLPLSLVVTVLLLLWKPTGLVLFVPFLCWPVMAIGERRMYLALAVLMAMVPLFLPLSMEVNYNLLQAYEALQSGDLGTAEKLLDAHPEGGADQFTVTYMHSLIALRRGDAEKAGAALERLAKMDTESDGVAVNRGVLAARNGDYEAAEKYFLQAIAKQASNPRALFNLSSLHAIRGDEDKTAQYRRWADTAASGELPIDELIHLPEQVSRLPLVDQPLPARALEPYFDFYSGTNFLAFHGEMLLFLGWLLAGGGLCGLLVFARERMDVDFNEYRKSNNDMASLKDRAWNQARMLNLVAPGLGMTFVGSPYQGTFLYLVVMVPVILWWSGGGFLANSVFPGMAEGPVPLVLALGLVAAAALFLLAQYLLWRRARDVEAR